MGVLIGFMANRSDCLLTALQREQDSFAPEPTEEPTGWGVGFYQDGEVLHKKRRRLTNATVDFSQIVDGVRSDCAIVHLRQATVGDFRIENTHPFRLRSWLFAHSGTVERFDAMKERMLETMPEFLQRSIRGETDSEHLFHMLGSFLHDAGELERTHDTKEPVLQAIRSTVRLIDRLCAEVGSQPPVLNSLLTDGHTLFAICRGAPMHYVERNLSSPPGPAPRSSVLPGGRYVLLEGARGKLPDDPTLVDHITVPDASICVIGRDLTVAVEAL